MVNRSLVKTVTREGFNNQDGTASKERAGNSVLDISTLIKNHHAAIYRYGYRLTGNHTDAEDLTQQTFMIAHQKIHQLRDFKKAIGWLYAILRTSFLKSARKSKPISAASIEMAVDEIPEADDRDDDLDGERLQQALNQLPDEFRVVLVMYYFEECSYKEIAEKLELPIGTVMSRLSRAKSRLRGSILAAEANVS